MSLLIRNVQILGGETDYPGPQDVFINGDKISAIGNFPTKSADEVLDGNGAYLSPGFIDVNTDSDHYLTLFSHPAQEDFLRQGVTTIFGGMCGASLAPLLYGSLESIQKWGDVKQINVDWHTMNELLSFFEKRPPGVNFGTLVGHSTIRRGIAGEEIRDLTKNELRVFGETLRRALEEGGFGLSTGLAYVHSYRTPYSELKFLADIVKEHDGIYATHLRRMDKEIGQAVDETMTLAKETGAKTLISHFVPFVGSEKEYQAALQAIDALPNELDFNFDIYPSDTSMMPLYTFLPDWAKSGGRDAMLQSLRDAWMWPRIVKDVPEIMADEFMVAQAPGKEFLIGRSLRELCKVYDIPDYRAALLKLMAATELRGLVFYRNINYEFVSRAIKSERALIASNAASFAYSGKMLKPERAVSTFTKFLGLAVQKLDVTSLKTAVAKITAEPARKFALKERGVVKEGYFADLTLFSTKFEKKRGATQRPEQLIEIKATVVNGQLAMKEGFPKKLSAGKILRRGKD